MSALFPYETGFITIKREWVTFCINIFLDKNVWWRKDVANMRNAEKKNWIRNKCFGQREKVSVLIL